MATKKPVKFSPASLNRLNPEASRYEVRGADEHKGLSVRIDPPGRVTFIYRYRDRINGKTVGQRVGTCPGKNAHNADRRATIIAAVEGIANIRKMQATRGSAAPSGFTSDLPKTVAVLCDRHGNSDQKISLALNGPINTVLRMCWPKEPLLDGRRELPEIQAAK